MWGYWIFQGLWFAGCLKSFNIFSFTISDRSGGREIDTIDQFEKACEIKFYVEEACRSVFCQGPDCSL